MLGELVNGGSLEQNWIIELKAEVFERARVDPKFPYVIAVARAVNALNFVHSAILHAQDNDSPEGQRERINSYLFASALLYEVMKLIRSMNRTFKDDPIFLGGLWAFQRDKAADQIWQENLNPIRNGAVFHFLPERFAEVVKSAEAKNYVFAAAREFRNKDVYYSFADDLTAEIHIGHPVDTPEFQTKLRQVAVETLRLVTKFTDDAQDLIGQHLERWGVGKVPTHVLPGNQSQD